MYVDAIIYFQSVIDMIFYHLSIVFIHLFNILYSWGGGDGGGGGGQGTK